MCGRKVGSKAKTFELTEQEKHTMRVLLQDEGPVSYCSACYRLVENPRGFAEFMRGVWLTKMRHAGVPDSIAEERAKKAYDFFLDRALKPRS
jgi:hypothetical protein